MASKFTTLKRRPASVVVASAGLLLVASLGLIFAERCQAVREQTTRPRRVSAAREGQRVISVEKGDDLQAAINAARCGDTVSVQAPESFVGNFHLPVKPCTDADPVTIQSSRAGELPGGVRVTPAQAALMPKLLTPNSQPALSTLAGAHHYRLIGLEISTSAGQFLYDLVAIGDPSAAQNTQEKIPHHFTIDRSYIHTTPEGEVIRGLDINADDVQVTNSHISGFKSKSNADTQAILTFSCNGRHLIENNYLEAAGENYISGGADAKIQGMVPSDIVIRKNHFSKPLAWRGVYGVKNLLELKNARRVTIDGNVFEYSWSSGQAGYAIVFTPRNQEGGNPWATIEDVQFTNNTIRHAASGVQLLGTDNMYPSQVMKRVTIRNNLWEDINSSWGPGLANKMFLVIDGPEDVTIERNTIRGDASAFALSGKPAVRLKVRANAFSNGSIVSDIGNGRAALERYAPNAVVTGNLMESVLRPDLYPGGNTYTAEPSSRPPAGLGHDPGALGRAQAKDSP
jgi:hypothetical protein